MTHTADDIQRLVAEQQVEFINLQFTDILGMVKNVTIPVAQLTDCLDHGVWFDGSSIEGLSRVRIAERDMYLAPDLDTFAIVPWNSEGGIVTARLICDAYTPDGKPFAGDPRVILKRVLGEAAQLGFDYLVSPEIEFFLFRAAEDGKPSLVPHDLAGYFDVSTDMATQVRRRIVQALGAFGIETEATHHEVAISQHEVDLKHVPALRAADQVVTFRTTVKAVAQQHKLYATMMPKPLNGVDGSGMHTHQSLRRVGSGENAFYDGNDTYGLSPTARHFIAGLLAHARGMIAVLAPLVNSYKRLVPGFEAPVYLTWGRTNRSALVRVPRIYSSRPQTTRVELRCPDPSCNPYLAFAVMLKAGLDGIKRELPLPEPAEEDLFQVDPRAFQLETLPRSLGEALAALQQDDLIAEALGPQIMERFVEAKLHEWNDYNSVVSEWERERYLPMY
ncbi:MAG TPA: glutamine synthetase family protein [Roseiflexaceae bacterium]|jgi:glutamine synthetase|nr:glutamine synthetase family protein [Roseiflexaceae bacterium]